MDNKILSGLRNDQKTDLSKGTIRNADAVLMLLHSAGGVARKGEIKKALQDWSGNNQTYCYLFKSYWNETHGFVGNSFEQSSFQIFNSSTSRYFTRRTYYYRTSRGKYSISAEGFKRLRELGF